MSYFYQATHKKNLESIKRHGLAPLIKRPAGVAHGATVNDRIKNEAGTVEKNLRAYLYMCFQQGHDLGKVVIHPAADLTLAPMTPTGVVVLGPVPLRKDIETLSILTNAYLSAYFEKLRGRAVKGKNEIKSALKENKMASIVDFRTNYPLMARNFVELMPDHFLSRLAIWHTRIYYDIEFKITSERIYFFAQSHFSKGFSSYAATIASSVYDDIAILRVSEEHTGQLEPDSGQGNAQTSKNVIPAEHIEYLTGASLSSVVDATIFAASGWKSLSSYGIEPLLGLTE